MHSSIQFDELDHRGVLRNSITLEDELDLGSRRRRKPMWMKTKQPNFAQAGGLDAFDDFQQGCLAGSIWAEQANQFPRPYL
ncbi:hypothetical protein A9K69_19470 [Stenotrophomonas maltophilia]|nr:hypothetical protein A9K69_19470 [Stenotrophomonas maltophilia]